MQSLCIIESITVLKNTSKEHFFHFELRKWKQPRESKGRSWSSSSSSRQCTPNLSISPFILHTKKWVVPDILQTTKSEIVFSTSHFRTFLAIPHHPPCFLTFTAPDQTALLIHFKNSVRFSRICSAGKVPHTTAHRKSQKHHWPPQHIRTFKDRCYVMTEQTFNETRLSSARCFPHILLHIPSKSDFWFL